MASKKKLPGSDQDPPPVTPPTESKEDLSKHWKTSAETIAVPGAGYQEKFTTPGMQEEEAEKRRAYNKLYYGVDKSDYKPSWQEELGALGKDADRLAYEFFNELVKPTANLVTGPDNLIRSAVDWGIKNYDTWGLSPQWLRDAARYRRPEMKDAAARLYAWGHAAVEGDISPENLNRIREQKNEEIARDDLLRKNLGSGWEFARDVMGEGGHLVGFIYGGPLKAASMIGEGVGFAGAKIIGKSSHNLARALKIPEEVIKQAASKGHLSTLILQRAAESKKWASAMKKPIEFLVKKDPKFADTAIGVGQHVLKTMAGFGIEGGIAGYQPQVDEKGDPISDEKGDPVMGDPLTIGTMTSLMTPFMLMAGKLGGISRQALLNKNWSDLTARTAGGFIEGLGFSAIDYENWFDGAKAFADGDWDGFFKAVRNAAVTATAFGGLKAFVPSATASNRRDNASKFSEEIDNDIFRRRSGITELDSLTESGWKSKTIEDNLGFVKSATFWAEGRGRFTLTADGDLTLGRSLASDLGVEQRTYRFDEVPKILKKIHDMTQISSLDQTLMDLGPRWEDVGDGTWFNGDKGYFTYRNGKFLIKPLGAKKWEQIEEAPRLLPVVEGEKGPGSTLIGEIMEQGNGGGMDVLAKWNIESIALEKSSLDQIKLAKIFENLLRVDPTEHPIGADLIGFLANPATAAMLIERDSPEYRSAVISALADIVTGKKSLQRGVQELMDPELEKMALESEMKALTEEVEEYAPKEPPAEAAPKAPTSEEATREVELARKEALTAPEAEIFHGTTRERFLEFDAGEFGFHFGAEGAAEMFGEARGVKLRVENPLRMKDLGIWDPEIVASEAWSKGVISDDELSEVKYDIEQGREFLKERLEAPDTEEGLRTNRQAQYELSRPVRELLEEKGYDGIIYRNEAEGHNDSVIAFRKEQITWSKEDALARAKAWEEYGVEIEEGGEPTPPGPLTAPAGAAPAEAAPSIKEGTEIGPREGYLYRSQHIPHMSEDDAGKLIWDPKGKAAGKDFGWVDPDAEGVIFEFADPSAGKTVYRTSKGKPSELANYNVGSLEAGRPERIFIVSTTDFSVEKEDVSKILESFPDAEIYYFAPKGYDQVESIIVGEQLSSPPAPAGAAPAEAKEPWEMTKEEKDAAIQEEAVQTWNEAMPKESQVTPEVMKGWAEEAQTEQAHLASVRISGEFREAGPFGGMGEPPAEPPKNLEREEGESKRDYRTRILAIAREYDATRGKRKGSTESIVAAIRSAGLSDVDRERRQSLKEQDQRSAYEQSLWKEQEAKKEAEGYSHYWAFETENDRNVELRRRAEREAGEKVALDYANKWAKRGLIAPEIVDAIGPDRQDFVKSVRGYIARDGMSLKKAVQEAIEEWEFNEDKYYEDLHGDLQFFQEFGERQSFRKSLDPDLDIPMTSAELTQRGKAERDADELRDPSLRDKRLEDEAWFQAMDKKFGRPDEGISSSSGEIIQSIRNQRGIPHRFVPWRKYSPYTSEENQPGVESSYEDRKQFKILSKLRPKYAEAAPEGPIPEPPVAKPAAEELPTTAYGPPDPNLFQDLKDSLGEFGTERPFEKEQYPPGPETGWTTPGGEQPPPGEPPKRIGSGDPEGLKFPIDLEGSDLGALYNFAIRNVVTTGLGGHNYKPAMTSVLRGKKWMQGFRDIWNRSAFSKDSKGKGFGAFLLKLIGDTERVYSSTTHDPAVQAARQLSFWVGTEINFGIGKGKITKQMLYEMFPGIDGLGALEDLFFYVSREGNPKYDADQSRFSKKYKEMIKEWDRDRHRKDRTDPLGRGQIKIDESVPGPGPIGIGKVKTEETVRREEALARGEDILDDVELRLWGYFARRLNEEGIYRSVEPKKFLNEIEKRIESSSGVIKEIWDRYFESKVKEKRLTREAYVEDYAARIYEPAIKIDPETNEPIEQALGTTYDEMSGVTLKHGPEHHRILGTMRDGVNLGLTPKSVSEHGSPRQANVADILEIYIAGHHRARAHSLVFKALTTQEIPTGIEAVRTIFGAKEAEEAQRVLNIKKGSADIPAPPPDTLAIEGKVPKHRPTKFVMVPSQELLDKGWIPIEHWVYELPSHLKRTGRNHYIAHPKVAQFLNVHLKKPQNLGGILNTIRAIRGFAVSSNLIGLFHFPVLLVESSFAAGASGKFLNPETMKWEPRPRFGSNALGRVMGILGADLILGSQMAFGKTRAPMEDLKKTEDESTDDYRNRMLEIAEGYKDTLGKFTQEDSTKSIVKAIKKARTHVSPGRLIQLSPGLIEEAIAAGWAPRQMGDTEIDSVKRVLLAGDQASAAVTKRINKFLFGEEIGLNVFRPLSIAKSALDRLLWDTTHDRLILAFWHYQRQELTEKVEKQWHKLRAEKEAEGGDPDLVPYPMRRDEISRRAMESTQSMFGGQNWDYALRYHTRLPFAGNMTLLDFMRNFWLAADWTTTNAKMGFRGLAGVFEFAAGLSTKGASKIIPDARLQAFLQSFGLPFEEASMLKLNPFEHMKVGGLGDGEGPEARFPLTSDFATAYFWRSWMLRGPVAMAIGATIAYTLLDDDEEDEDIWARGGKKARAGRLAFISNRLAKRLDDNPGDQESVPTVKEFRDHLMKSGTWDPETFPEHLRDWTNLYLGRDQEGKQRWLSFGKQFAEFEHMITNPWDQILRKRGPLPRWIQMFISGKDDLGRPLIPDEERMELGEKAIAWMKVYGSTFLPIFGQTTGRTLLTLPLKGLSRFKARLYFETMLYEHARTGAFSPLDVAKNLMLAEGNGINSYEAFQSAMSSVRSELYGRLMEELLDSKDTSDVVRQLTRLGATANDVHGALGVSKDTTGEGPEERTTYRVGKAGRLQNVMRTNRGRLIDFKEDYGQSFEKFAGIWASRVFRRKPITNWAKGYEGQGGFGTNLVQGAHMSDEEKKQHTDDFDEGVALNTFRGALKEWSATFTKRSTRQLKMK